MPRKKCIGMTGERLIKPKVPKRFDGRNKKTTFRPRRKVVLFVQWQPLQPLQFPLQEAGAV